MKRFNTVGQCVPGIHYMVDIKDKLQKIKVLVDDGYYFVINRARQYGKTTTLKALIDYLDNQYGVIFLSFQRMSAAKFENEKSFSSAFADAFIKAVRNKRKPVRGLDEDLLSKLECDSKDLDLVELFNYLSDLCQSSKRPLVLIIDEVDSASNNQVFMDFLAQLRDLYIERFDTPTFQSVILAGVYDITNLKRKIRPDDEHKYNSPWNIAETFDVDMSFSTDGIAGMLRDYENDHETGMDIAEVAQSIYDYTSGYPFLVSLICKTIDDHIMEKGIHLTGNAAWSADGVNDAVRIILREPASIFESMIKQVESYPELRDMLQAILFQGSLLAYNPDHIAVSLGAMFGFIKEKNGYITVSNRIFEVRLYNYFLSELQLTSASYLEAQKNRNQFIQDGRLNMELVMKKFVIHFHDVYGDNDQKFIEEYGRKFFLLYLKPIINGTGNYYIEAQTRDAKRTDIIVDYLGERFVIELKIWGGQKYNTDGEAQVAGYLERYHLKKGYLLSFSFNKNKEIGVREVTYEDKMIIEAIV